MNPDENPPKPIAPLSGTEVAPTQDEEHLRLLSIFHYVCAGLAAIFATFPIIHLILGFTMLINPQIFGPGKDQPPAFVGLILVIMGSVFILFGWAFTLCLVFAGRCLAQRRNYTFCLIMAGVACIFMPFGTILGIFTILTLVKPTVKALFIAATPPAFSQ